MDDVEQGILRDIKHSEDRLTWIREAVEGLHVARDVADVEGNVSLSMDVRQIEGRCLSILDRREEDLARLRESLDGYREELEADAN